MDAATLNYIQDLFDRFDENHNGMLEKEEFYKGFNELVKSLAEGHSDEDIKQITEEAIDKFDLNHNGKIEIDEFNQLMWFLINEKGLAIDELN